MMLTRRFVLMWLIIAASAVDLPDPVTPVTSTRPRGFSASSSNTNGRFSSRSVFTSYGMARNANATVPRCWYTLVRNRPTPGTPIAKSASLCSAISLTCRGVMICSASDFSSSGLSACWSSPTSSPFTRTVAGRPTLSSRSEPLRRTISAMAALKLNAAPAAGRCSAIGIHPVKDLPELHGLRVLHSDFADHTVQLRFDLVHDLHRLDDADHLARRDPAADFDVRLGPGLGRGIERPHHRRLDLEQLARGGGGRRFRPAPARPRGTGDAAGGMPGHLGDDHVVGVVPRFGPPDRRPDAEH